MTYYKTIVGLTNGRHKILRLQKNEVAHVVTEVRKFKNSIFREVVKITLNGCVLCLNEILSWKFINEYTGEDFLTI